ncbi:MAG TPA: methyltransferase [Jatrophihabitantaceae bacterium]|jgi:SAM-dependent methyltransferase|nr:methyltransferase [Jatrophihabitantaceae bacterium]
MEDAGPLPEEATAPPSLVPGLPGLAESLATVGYSSSGLHAVLGNADLLATPADLAIYERRLASAAGPLADVIALLALGWPRTVEGIVDALGRSAVDALVASGCVIESGNDVQPAVRIVPHRGLWLAADRRHDVGTAPDPLQVTGINPPATLLAALTVRRPARRALDVGTGNGIQALLAARHSGHVVATDVNPRALEFAAFNAAVNGIDGIEFRSGSLLEPVAGERFDLVVSNPPYVISPEHAFVFRDSGAAPGALCAALVHALPDVLAPGGFATVLASWPVRDAPWDSVPSSWLGDGCRAWLLQLRSEDPVLHARQWNQPLADAGDVAGFGAAVDRWVRYLAEHHIDQIAYGAVVLQEHPGAPTVIRSDQVRAGAGGASAHIERVFAAYSMLRDGAYRGLADWTCHVPAEHRMERALHFVDGSWRHGDALITLTEGVGIEATIDPLMSEILLRVSSGATVTAAATAVGEQAGINPEQLDGLVAAAVAMVRELIATGIVEPGPAPD